MQCNEVIRELAVPSDDREDLALAQHLAECKTCARWADRAAKLDRLWDATRPTDPSPDTWEGLWSSVTARLDQSSRAADQYSWPARTSDAISSGASHRSSMSARPWRGLAAIGMIGLAQAAALLLAIGLSWNVPVNTPQLPKISPGPDLAQLTAPSLDSEVDIEEGQVVVIRSEGPTVKIINLTTLEMANSEDPLYVFHSRMESASTVVAMTE